MAALQRGESPECIDVPNALYDELYSYDGDILDPEDAEWADHLLVLAMDSDGDREDR
jgi:hypothetical protein